jgi:chromosome segregation ATPase
LAGKAKEAKEATQKAAKRDTEVQEQLDSMAAAKEAQEKAIKALQAEVAKQKEKGEALKVSIEHVEALKKELEAVQKDSKAKTDQNQKFVAEVAALKKEMAARTDETKKLAEQLKAANQEQAKATAKHTQEQEAQKLHLQELLHQKTLEATEAHKTVKGLMAEESKRAKEHEKEAKRIADVLKEFEALRATGQERDRHLSALEEDIKTKDARIGLLQKAIVETQGKWDEERKRLVHEVEALNKQIKEKGKPDNQVKALEEQVKDLEGLIQALEDDCSQKASEIQERNARIWKLEVAVKETEAQMAELEGRIEVQQIEEASRKSPLRERSIEKEADPSVKKRKRDSSAELEQKSVVWAQELQLRDQIITELTTQLHSVKGELTVAQKELIESKARLQKTEAGAAELKKSLTVMVKKVEAKLKEAISREKVAQSHLNKLEMKDTEAASRTAKLESHLEEALEAQYELENAIEQVESERDHFEKKFEEAQKQSKDLKAQLKRTEDKLRKKDTAGVETARAKKKADARKKVEADRQAKAAKRTAELERMVDEQEKELEGMIEEKEELKAQLEKAQKGTQKQLQKAKTEALSERARADKVTKKLAEIRKERVKEADETTKWRKEAGKLRAEIGQWEADFLERAASEKMAIEQIGLLGKERAKLLLNIKQLEKELQREKERKVEDIDKKLTDAKKREAALVAENTNLSNVLKTIEDSSEEVEKVKAKLKTLKATAQKDREVRIRLEKKVKELEKKAKQLGQAEDDLKRIRGERDGANEAAAATKELFDFLLTLLEELGKGDSKKDWGKLTDQKPLKAVQAHAELAKLGKKAVSFLNTLRDKQSKRRVPEQQESVAPKSKGRSQRNRGVSQKVQEPVLGKRGTREYHEVEALENQIRELKTTNSELRQRLRTWKSFESNYFNMYCCEGVRLCSRKGKRTE